MVGTVDDQHKRLREQVEQVVARARAKTPNAQEIFEQLVHQLNLYSVELEMRLKEIQQLNARLEDANRRGRELFDVAPVGYLVTDKRGLILKANTVAAELFGREVVTLHNQLLAELMAAEHQDTYDRHLRTALNEGQAQTALRAIRQGDGEVDVELVSRRRAGNIPTILTAMICVSARHEPDC